MNDRDLTIAKALDPLVPATGSNGDWEAVVRDAGHGRRPLAVVIAPVAVILAVAAAALLWPFGGQQQVSVLERALAAVGNGPVLHVVLRGEWGGTLIDLQTAAREPVYGERELWYDPERGVRQIVRFGGQVQEDTFRPVDELGRYEPKVLRLLADDYRDALASGRARNLGPGEAYGEPVYWLRVDAESLPDAADGKDHEWAHDVAVSRSTFEPVATRETRDGNPGPGTGERILQLESVERSHAVLTPTGPRGLDGTAFSEGREQIPPEDALEALGRTPLWLGRTYAGLPLAQVVRKDTKTGRSEQRLITGRLAEDARDCLATRDRLQELPGSCARLRELGHGVSIRGKNVYVNGPVEWGPERHGLVLFYGRLEDDPSTYKNDPGPSLEAPHVMLTEAADRLAEHGPPSYDVPAGSILVMPGRFGLLQLDGLHVSIEASSDELLVSAARALESMPD
jgi:hypothetical protein